MAGDWKTIKDDREKYAAYLCSREWAEKRDAVHRRARQGNCERCDTFRIDAVHHLTYARKYHENLEDLEGHCKWCHGFVHKKHDFDPAKDPFESFRLLLYIDSCQHRNINKHPLPCRFQDGSVSPNVELQTTFTAIEQLLTLGIGRDDPAGRRILIAIRVLNACLPFDYFMALQMEITSASPDAYRRVLALYGYEDLWSDEWGTCDKEDVDG